MQPKKDELKVKYENNKKSSSIIWTKKHLVCLRDFEHEAAKLLPKLALDYYRSGAGDEISLRRNTNAFSRWLIMPRVLVDVSQRTPKTRVLGREVSLPFGISPTAMQRMAHPQGEVASAAAATRLGTVFTLSSLSTSSMEEVTQGASGGIRWFQLYIYRDREVALQLVRRAEISGYEAIVLTVDAPIFGTRYADTRNQFALPPHLCLANFVGVAPNKVNTGESGSGLNEYVASLFDQSLSWQDIAWLKKVTSLPIVLKGILTPEDAIHAADEGVAAIVVSNHGARQLDSVPASIEVLPGIVSALSGRNCEIYLDGGIRSGTDIFKALALGASMVFVGRPVLWGLACGGEEGVVRILSILRDELDTAMALTGCCTVKEITKNYVASVANKL